MNIAQLRRFESLELHYLEENVERQVVKAQVPNAKDSDVKHLVAVAVDSRTLYHRGLIATPLTTGNVLNYAKMYATENADDDAIGVIIQSMYPVEEEGQYMQMLWKGGKTADQIIKEFGGGEL